MRALSWEGCVNVRDLGGLPTGDGGVTRNRAVVRADSTSSLSDAGWAALVAYGVKRIIDLRFHSELAADPPRDLPVEVVHVPVLPELGTADLVEIDQVAGATPDTTAAVTYAYLEFLDRFRTRFAKAIEEVSLAPEGAVLIHCLGGKDRTGLVVALLLRIAGVPISDIAEDYGLSAGNLRVLDEKWIAEAPDDHERRRRERVTSSPPEAMVTVLKTLEHRYGSVTGYLTSSGIYEEAPARIMSRLR
jgi:protein-tyrosine phosphatase